MAFKYTNNNTPLPEATELKNYTIIKAIDTGGYSIVYYAYDRKMNNYVAIKEFMPSHLDLRKQGKEVLIKDSEVLKIYNILLRTFFDEIKMINRINHPNIVKSIDYFIANNTAYLVTPYEVGEPLSAFMNNVRRQGKSINEDDIFYITTGILKAVQEMHRNGVLHLDLKPNNIWLRPNKDVVILDFGTAILDGKPRDLMVYTGGFAAIELYANAIIADKTFSEIQHKINASKNNIVGKWTDYYAIGATLYNMITYNLPPLAYDLYLKGQQIDTSKMYGTTHVKLIDTINQLCQHDITARKNINLHNIANTLKNAKPYPKYHIDLSEIIANKPNYVMKPIGIGR